jgi:hypothetical protein
MTRPTYWEPKNAAAVEERIEAFFTYARERYRIMVAKNVGMEKPWTKDPILQKYRFCNIFREDDKVTVWFRDNVRNPMRDDPNVVFACVLFRMINCIPTGEVLLKHDLFKAWDEKKARKVCGNLKPLVGAAYMITTPVGLDKLDGIMEVVRPVSDNLFKVSAAVSLAPTMKSLVEYLSTFHYIGPFRAYEMACDLQYTDWFHPTDTMTWANTGPGAARGIDRIINGRLCDLFHNRKSDQELLVNVMRELLFRAGQVSYWPGHWPRWDLRTVEHTLCEFDKYQRALTGDGKPKQNYPGIP